MSFKHKLSSRLALLRDALSLLAAVAAFSACEVPTASSANTTHPIVQVVIVPDSLSLDPAQQMAFAAYGRGASGDSSGVSVSWSATGGSISSSGMFVAGTVPGDFVVTGASATLNLSATARVHVRPRPVASVSVSPTAVSVSVAQTVQLGATPRDASGNALTGRVITWGSSNTGVATVSAGGLVTGVAAGSATMTATSEGRSGTAAITVTSTPAPVASVGVSPSGPSVVAGQTVQLTATPRDASGNTLTGRVVTWTSSNTAAATVNGSGLVTGVAAGSATITATSEGQSGTSAVTVQSASSGSECATPQPGRIWCDDFDVNRLSSYYEYDAAGGKFARVAGVGRNGSYGMRVQFAPGDVSAGSLHLAFGKTPSSYWAAVDGGTTQYRDLYWRLYYRNQPGWVTSTNTDKMTRALVFAGTNFSEAAFAHLWSGQGSAVNYFTLDPASGTDAAGNLRTTQYNDFANMTWLGLVQGTTPAFATSTAGTWYCVEVHAQLNDAGQANGVFEFWMNGSLEARKTGINWLGSYSAFAWNAVFIENYINAGAPQAQERYFDDFVVSTQRIGC